MINSRVPSSLLVSRIATDIVQQQNSLAAVQEQISTGKKINRPSDAPAETAHLLSMGETISRIEQYTENSSIAESQLALEEGALAGTTSALNRVRDLVLRVNTDTANAGFREETNSEVKLIREELFSLANARDSFGNYLFGGNNIHDLPFKPGNPPTYSGSDETTKMEIALGRTIETGDSGIDVFMRIRNGNGDFNTTADPANTGSGIVEKGAVTDGSLARGGNYSITFNSNNDFDVIDDMTGAVVLAAEPYESGSRINLPGMTFSINGVPDAGDTFSVVPSEYEDIFTTMSNLIDSLDKTPIDSKTRADGQSALNTAVAQIDNALMHFNTTRAKVGTRLSSIESSRNENESIGLQIERIKQNVEDVDIADAVTRLQTQANSLEILQKSFTRIEGLSLFNFM